MDSKNNEASKVSVVDTCTATQTHLYNTSSNTNKSKYRQHGQEDWLPQSCTPLQ